MGLEEVRKEIIEKAKREADSLLKEADKESKQLVSETKDRIEEYRKSADVQRDLQIASMEKVYSASANASAKSIIISKSFDESGKMIVKQSKQKRYAENLLRKAEAEIQIGTVYCNKQDVSGISGIKPYSVYAENISGGIIAENTDGTVRVDLSFDSILSDIKAKNLHTIAEILFGVRT